MGVPNYFQANLIKCFSSKECYTLRVENSDIAIPHEGIGGIFSTPAATMILNRNRVGNAQERSSSGMPTTHSRQFALSNDPTRKRKRASTHMCILRSIEQFPFICETCIHKCSDSGSMERHFIQYKDMQGYIYVIETLDDKAFSTSCYTTNFCKGSSFVLPYQLCNIFKDRISANSNAHVQIFVPRLRIRIEDHVLQKIKLTNAQSQKLNCLSRHINGPSYCLEVPKAFDESGKYCWECLSRHFEGLVVLDSAEVDSIEQDLFYMYLFTAKSNILIESERCSSSCGKVDFSSHCHSEVRHVTHLLPPQNIITWMERVADKSNTGPGCFVVRRLLLSKCLECFKDSTLHRLTPLTFLVALGPDSNALKALRCSVGEGACADFDLVPYDFCEYEFEKSKRTNIELWQNPSAYYSQNALYGFDASIAGMVQVFEWLPQHDPNSRKFGYCVACFALKLKVVLVSASEKYLWLVNGNCLPVCEGCNERLKPGPLFPYDQYLRQIPIVDVMTYFEIARA